MYPVLLDIAGKPCVVIGGGGVAERKVMGLLEAGALVTIVSPEVTAGLAGLAGQGRVEWRKKEYAAADLAGAVLVFAATDNRDAQESIIRDARAGGQLLNVADDPESCTFHVPASLRRGDLTVSVATNGKSPAVAAFVRQQLEEQFGPEYDLLLQAVSQVRQHIISRMGNLSQEERKKIYKKILHGDIINSLRAGRVDALQNCLHDIAGLRIELDLNPGKPDNR